MCALQVFKYVILNCMCGQLSSGLNTPGYLNAVQLSHDLCVTTPKRLPEVIGDVGVDNHRADDSAALVLLNRLCS